MTHKISDEASDRAYRNSVVREETRARQRVEEERISAVAHAAVDKRVAGWAWLGALAALTIWNGWIGVVVWIASFAAWTGYQHWVAERTPGADPDAAEGEAETYVRLSILADLQQRGELRFEPKEGHVAASNHPEWDTFWTRLEVVRDEFEKCSPRTRRDRIAELKKRSLPARLSMARFAESHGLKSIWWAGLEQGESRS